MTFSFNPTPDSLFTFYKNACPRHPQAKQRRSVAVFVCRAVIICLAIWASLAAPNYLVKTISLVLFALGLRLTPIFYDQWFERSLRSHVRAADPGTFGLHEVTVSTDGFRELTPVTDTFIRWSGVKQVESLPGLVIVYLENGLSAVISDEDYHGSSPFSDLFAIFEGFRQKYGTTQNVASEPVEARAAGEAWQIATGRARRTEAHICRPLARTLSEVRSSRKIAEFADFFADRELFLAT